MISSSHALSRRDACHHLPHRARHRRRHADVARAERRPRRRVLGRRQQCPVLARLGLVVEVVDRPPEVRRDVEPRLRHVRRVLRVRASATPRNERGSDDRDAPDGERKDTRLRATNERTNVPCADANDSSHAAMRVRFGPTPAARRRPREEGGARAASRRLVEGARCDRGERERVENAGSQPLPLNGPNFMPDDVSMIGSVLE